MIIHWVSAFGTQRNFDEQTLNFRYGSSPAVYYHSHICPFLAGNSHLIIEGQTTIATKTVVYPYISCLD